MQNLLDELTQLLQKDDRFTVEGKLLKNKVIEAALQLDPALLKLLLSHKSAKNHFFQEVDGITVFDKTKFQKFISNKSFLPDSYTAFKNKIGLTSNDEFISEGKEVVLSWPYKDCVLEGGQTKEDEKRDEIFWNETLAPDEIDRLLSPKVFTNFKKYDSKGEHKVTNISLEDNLIIKGNNLLALRSLLTIYRETIKLIYIDPPYNTGNDEFGYNDSFNQSTWLTFIKNRVSIGHELLNNTGLFYIQVDEKELAYVRIVLDEIFGSNNFVSLITWQRAPEGRVVLGQGSTFIVDTCEYLLCYAKNKSSAPTESNVTKLVEATDKALNQYNYFFKDEGNKKLYKEIKGSNGTPIKIYCHSNYKLEKIPKRVPVSERIENFKYLARIAAQQEESSLQQKILQSISADTLYSIEYVPTTGKSKGTLKKSYYFNNGILLILSDYATLIDNLIYRNAKMNNFWNNDEIQVTGISEEGGVILRRGKKPEELLRRIIEMSTNEGDLVLDFFLGSGTTAAVSLKLNRKFIGIEQLNYGKNDSIIRLKNVVKGDKSGISKEVSWEGGSSFIHFKLAELNQQLADNINSAKTTKELEKIWGTIKKDGFISYKVNPKEIDKNISEFEQLSLKDQKKFLIEVLDKNHLYVNFSEIDDKDYKISEEDKKLNKKFYSLK